VVLVILFLLQCLNVICVAIVSLIQLCSVLICGAARVAAVSGRSGCSDPSVTVQTAPAAVSWQASPAPGSVRTCIILSFGDII